MNCFYFVFLLTPTGNIFRIVLLSPHQGLYDAIKVSSNAEMRCVNCERYLTHCASFSPLRPAIEAKKQCLLGNKFREGSMSSPQRIISYCQMTTYVPASTCIVAFQGIFQHVVLNLLIRTKKSVQDGNSVQE